MLLPAGLVAASYALLFHGTGYAQRSQATTLAFPLHLLATGVFIGLAYRAKTRRRIAAAVASVASLLLAALLSLSNLYFWNAGP